MTESRSFFQIRLGKRKRGILTILGSGIGGPIQFEAVDLTCELQDFSTLVESKINLALL